MSEQIDAIYDNGVFRPLTPLSLPDKTHVTLTVDGPTDRGSIDTSEHPKAVADFDAELDALLFDGPNLPADFSRADIYADHD